MLERQILIILISIIDSFKTTSIINKIMYYLLNKGIMDKNEKRS